MEFQKLKEKVMPKKPINDDAENRHWHSYKVLIHLQIFCKFIVINTMLENNQKSHIAIAHGQQVQIYNTRKNEFTKKMQFKNALSALAIRFDSQLLAVGLEDGFISVMNLKTKTSLRSFKLKKPIQTLYYSGMENLYAASDSIKLFDISTEKIVRSLNAHDDYVKSICGMDSYLLTSSYDGKIKLFDFRIDEALIKTFDAGLPVEQIISISNYQFVSAEQEQTSLWDVRESKIQSLNINQKTVTSLTTIPYRDTFRIVTGSLDHQIKYIRPDLFSVTHQQKWNHPVVCLDATQGGPNLAVGSADGYIEILQHEQLQEDKDENEEEFIPDFLKQNPHLQRKVRDYKFYNRGIYQKISNYDIIIGVKQKFKEFDSLLVQFRYKEAILKAFREKKSSFILSLYEELSNRGALITAFQNLDEKELQEIINYIKQKICNPKYQHTLILITEVLESIYKLNDQELLKAIQDELEVQQQLMKIKGILNFN